MTVYADTGAYRADLAEVLAVETPESTETYQAAAYGDLISSVRKNAADALGSDAYRSESWALAAKGKQLFGTMTFDTGHSDHGLAIGLRSSHDSSLSVGIAVGASVFVCSNLCFSGDSVTLMRKHTSQFWESWEGLVVNALAKADEQYGVMTKQLAALHLVDVDQDEGYGLIGVAAGTGVLSQRQTHAALRAWRNAPQEEFAPRNGWSLYNAMTEGAKKGAAGAKLDAHTGIHAFARQRILLAA
jgi:hypothetical protein